MVHGSGEYEAGEENILQSAPDSWPGLRPNHHFSKFFTAHQSTSIDQLILIIVCTSFSFSTAVLGEIFSRTYYSQKKSEIRKLFL